MNTRHDPFVIKNEIKEALQNQDFHFIITGANGWLGKATIEFLHSYFGNKFDKKIFAISSSSKLIRLRNNVSIDTINYDHNFPKNKNYILLHFAFLTKDKVSQMSHAEYLEKNQKIRDDVTRIVEKISPKAMIYSSSGAVYNKDDSYGELKLKDEDYFLNLAKNHNFDIIIPRIFNMAGPYINKINLYALSDFISQALNKNLITINAKNQVIRSYIHINDLLKICLSWIIDPKKYEHQIIFDTANQDELELADLALIVKNLIGTNVEISRKEFDKNLNSNRYVGKNEIQQLLCKRYFIDIMPHKQIVQDTYEYAKELLRDEKYNN